jgi:hypothetical protein
MGDLRLSTYFGKLERIFNGADHLRRSAIQVVPVRDRAQQIGPILKPGPDHNADWTPAGSQSLQRRQQSLTDQAAFQTSRYLLNRLGHVPRVLVGKQISDQRLIARPACASGERTTGDRNEQNRTQLRGDSCGFGLFAVFAGQFAGKDKRITKIQRQGLRTLNHPAK